VGRRGRTLARSRHRFGPGSSARQPATVGAVLLRSYHEQLEPLTKSRAKRGHEGCGRRATARCPQYV
jgi:hypothetical protein